MGQGGVPRGSGVSPGHGTVGALKPAVQAVSCCLRLQPTAPTLGIQSMTQRRPSTYETVATLQTTHIFRLGMPRACSPDTKADNVQSIICIRHPSHQDPRANGLQLHRARRGGPTLRESFHRACAQD